MIGSLRGTLLERLSGSEVLIEVSGIGYRVTVNPNTVVALGELGHEVFLHIHHHQREDGQTLYGFSSRDERICYEALLGAHGVGPALALAILSVHEPMQLRRVLADDDVSALCLVPGVGRKTATRLLVELKSRLDLPDMVDLAALAAGEGGPSRGAPRPLDDVREALAGLGYGPDEVRHAVADLDPNGDAAQLLKQALKLLSTVRNG